MALATRPREFVAYAPTWWARSQSTDQAPAGNTTTSSLSSDGSNLSKAADDPAAEQERETESAGTSQAHADVLVVDDDADVRWTVAEILRSAGLSVAEAEDGEVALGLLSTGSYRMVLLDMRMPKRDGVSLMEALEEVPPVIIHSAYSLDGEDRDRLGSRVVDYLHKPVSPQKLLRAVEAVLGPPQ
jgi:two-component system chemotaxis response regulator CheY